MCSVKSSQNIFMQSLPLYTSSLFSIPLNENKVYIEKCLLTFLVDNFLGFFLHASMFSIKNLRSSWIINGFLLDLPNC